MPVPSASELENYIVYVGFDPEGVQPQKPPSKPRGGRSRSNQAKPN